MNKSDIINQKINKILEIKLKRTYSKVVIDRDFITNIEPQFEASIFKKVKWLLDAEFEDADISVIGKKLTWHGGNWNKGVFKGDVWENGIFIDGTFKGRIWKGGMTIGGIWDGGDWKEGSWGNDMKWISGKVFGKKSKFSPNDERRLFE